jgi:hypothetical protein
MQRSQSLMPWPAVRQASCVARGTATGILRPPGPERAHALERSAERLHVHPRERHRVIGQPHARPGQHGCDRAKQRDQDNRETHRASRRAWDSLISLVRTLCRSGPAKCDLSRPRPCSRGRHLRLFRLTQGSVSAPHDHAKAECPRYAFRRRLIRAACEVSRDGAVGRLSRALPASHSRWARRKWVGFADRLPGRHRARRCRGLRHVVARVGNRHKRCRRRPLGHHGLSAPTNELREARQRPGLVSTGESSRAWLGEDQRLAHALGLRSAGNKRWQCVHAPRRSDLERGRTHLRAWIPQHQGNPPNAPPR